MTHKEEEKNLFMSFLNTHFFYGWKNTSNSGYRNSIELEVSPTCNTQCSYCYYKNFQNYLYPAHINKSNQIVENCKKLLDWIVSENFKNISSFDIFSGEFFMFPRYKDILNLICDANRRMGTHIIISLPTNATFCLSEEKTREVQEVIDNVTEQGTPIRLSLSIDGYYLDNETRKLKNGELYTDEYYDRAFRFGEENKFAYHPMVGAKGIENWEKNFDWYIKNITKYYGISERKAYELIYLLEVRNPDWTESELKHFYNFIYNLVKRTYSVYDGVKDYVENYMFVGQSNLFSSLIGHVSRGLGCSIQSTLMVRLGDLAIVPCHRTSYDEYIAGYMKFTENGMDIELKNPNTYMMIEGFDSEKCSVCSGCPINHLCGKFCYGCNYEINKDFFTPVRSVCKLEMTKVLALSRAIKDLGILNYIKDNSNNFFLKEKVSEIENFLKNTSEGELI